MTSPFGLSSENLELVKNRLTETFRKKDEFKISVFGSRSSGAHKKYSDLDLWIEAIPAATHEEISQLIDFFSNSDLPIKIDLVTPVTCLPEYRSSIEAHLKFWFSKTI